MFSLVAWVRWYPILWEDEAPWNRQKRDQKSIKSFTKTITKLCPKYTLKSDYNHNQSKPKWEPKSVHNIHENQTKIITKTITKNRPKLEQKHNKRITTLVTKSVQNIHQNQTKKTTKTYHNENQNQTIPRTKNWTKSEPKQNKIITKKVTKNRPYLLNFDLLLWMFLISSCIVPSFTAFWAMDNASFSSKCFLHCLLLWRLMFTFIIGNFFYFGPFSLPGNLGGGGAVTNR